MSYISLGILGLTFFCILVGALLGLLRGRNRAILRLCLVLASAILAVVLIDVLVPIVLDIEIEGETIKELVSESFKDVELPESILDIIFTLIEVVVGIALYFVLFVVLKCLTWALFDPILKIFIKKGEKKHPVIGMIIGIVQGFIVSFLVCAPVTGLAKNFYDISQIEMDGEVLVEIPEEVGFEDYINSGTFGFYNATGNWFYEFIASAKLEDGTKLSMDSAVEIVIVTTDIASMAQDITNTIERLERDDTTDLDIIDDLDLIGDKLIEMDELLNSVGDDSKEVIQSVVQSLAEMLTGSEEEIPQEIIDYIENLDVDDVNLDTTGEAIKGISTYMSKQTEGTADYGEPTTQKEVNEIVDGMADNAFILDMFTSDNEGALADTIKEEDKSMFEDAINSNSKLTAEEKDKFLSLLGISA